MLPIIYHSQAKIPAIYLVITDLPDRVHTTVIEPIGRSENWFVHAAHPLAPPDWESSTQRQVWRYGQAERRDQECGCTKLTGLSSSHRMLMTRVTKSLHTFSPECCASSHLPYDGLLRWDDFYKIPVYADEVLCMEHYICLYLRGWKNDQLCHGSLH